MSTLPEPIALPVDEDSEPAPGGYFGGPSGIRPQPAPGGRPADYEGEKERVA